MPEILLDRVTKRFDRSTGAATGATAPGSAGTKAIAAGAVTSRAAATGAALDGVTLAVERGEIVVVVGPSGSGKSTTLRIVAGLEQPDGGEVSIAGRAMRGVPPQERDVAMVFQGYALYPQMTARQILEFPLKMRGVPVPERARAVAEAAAMLHIEALLDRRPGELSGGEQQRVAMGRAIVRKPRVFLFDEPLSNLDASLRGDLRLEIGRLVRRLGATALYVTHDHIEAMTLGDRIAVMRAGRIVQLGTPREIYEHPATSFVGAFLGTPRMNLLAAQVEGDTVVAGPFRIPCPRTATSAQAVTLGIRPEHLRITSTHSSDATGVGAPTNAAEGASAPTNAAEGANAPTNAAEAANAPAIVAKSQDAAANALKGKDAANIAKGEVVAIEPLGAETHLVVRVGEFELRARVAGFDASRRGDLVHVSFDAGRALVFSAGENGARLD